MNRIKNWKKQFAVIYTGQAFSILGSAAVQFAVIWWLTIQTESAITLTIASLVAFLPNMLIGPFAGVWIDRYNRRTVMILADGLVAVSSIILGAAFLLVETPPIWFIYIKRTSNLRTIEQNLARLYADVHDDVAVRKLWVWCGDVRAFAWAFRL